MERMSRSERWGFGLFLLAAALTLGALAFPNMSRYVTIPGAVICFVVALFCFGPDIKHIAVRHARKTIAGIIVIVAAASCAVWYFWPAIEDAMTSCKLSPVVESRIVSRLHSRNPVPTTETRMADFQFQELFYEWRLDIKPTSPVADVFIEISHLSKDEATKIKPENANVSELKPRWMSGFPELSRKNPDFFARTISFGRLDQNHGAAIVIRRNLTVPGVAPIQVITIDDLLVPDCTIITPINDVEDNSRWLTKQAVAFSKERFSKSAPATGLPIGKDLGDTPLGETDASVEAWCEDLNCTKFIVGNLEARIGDDQFREIDKSE